MSQKENSQITQELSQLRERVEKCETLISELKDWHDTIQLALYTVRPLISDEQRTALTHQFSPETTELLNAHSTSSN